MKKFTALFLFVVFAMGLMSCSTNESPADSKKAPEATANRSDTNSAANAAPATTPPGDTEGKSDADKSGDGKSDADK